MRIFITGLLAGILALSLESAEIDFRYYSRWQNSLPADSTFFPIGVWLQNPGRAAEYKACGINIYIALYDGPNEGQLAALKSAGMYTICEQNQTALTSPNRSIIVGWMQQDEPDLAQSDGSGGYGPCIDPSVIQANYSRLKTADPTRPVFLNLSHAVAYTSSGGRGSCANRTDMYPEYCKGADIESFDIYPVADGLDIWYLPKGIDSLRMWSGDTKPVWCVVEGTHVNGSYMATPAQLKTEIWMALIHGAKGFLYFCHEFAPSFSETAWLDRYPAMKSAITAINAEIKSLAPVLYSQSVPNVATVKANNWRAMPKMMTKVRNGYTYLFMAHERNFAARDTFRISGLPATATATVLSEGRTIPVVNGMFTDSTAAYGLHLYRINAAGSVGAKDPAQQPARRLADGISFFENPCYGGLTVLLQRDLAGEKVTLAIFDLTGRKLRDIHGSVWDGRDAQSREAMNGVYYLQAGLRTASLMKPFVFMR